MPFFREMALEALTKRHKLAEPILELATDGPDKGKRRLARVKTKPHWAYAFEVDRAMNVTAIKTTDASGRQRRLDPEHFVWLTWDSKDGNPVGTSALDAAHHAWSLLVKLWPEAFKGWRMFGTPSVVGKKANSEKVVQREEGQKPIKAKDAMAAGLVRWQNGSVMVVGQDDEVDVVESARDGATINAAIALLEGQIIRSILLQIRATVEARHGSRADSETGQDILGTLVRYIRSWLCSMWRQVLWILVEANYGEDVADRLTPEVSLGKIEPHDFAAFAGAVALLHQSGFFTEAQLPSIDAMLDLPPRKPGDPRVRPQKDKAGSDTAAPPDGQATPKTAPDAGAAALHLELAEIRAAIDTIKSAVEAKGVAA
jgi:hypothetical protein